MRLIPSDLRYAARGLARNRGFAAMAIATLALGIGGNAALFGIVERIAMRSLPFPDAPRLVRLRDAVVAPGGDLYRALMLPWHYDAIAQGTKSFDAILAALPQRLTLVGRPDAFSFEGVRVTPGALARLGVRPRLGRLFTPEEEAQGETSRAALVSSAFWKTRLGGRDDVLGSALALADGTATVVGVLPDGFRFPYTSDVWRPFRVVATDPRDLFVVARLAPGVGLAQAAAEMDALARRAEAEGPPTMRGRGIDVTRLKEDLLAGEDRVPLTLMAAVAFLLLLACVNLAALFLSRSVARQREMGIRAALGASRARRLRQDLGESLLLAALGAGLGLVLARAADGFLAALVPHVLGEDLPTPQGGRFGVFLFVAALATVAGVLCGLVPAWRASRIDPASLLRAAGRSTSPTQSTRRLLSLFAFVEIALATVLTGCGALMLADLRERESRRLGLDPDHLLSVEVPLGEAAGASPERRRALVERLVAAAASVPGVASAAATTANPFSDRRWGMPIAADRDLDPTRELSTVNLRLVTPGLFATWKTRVLAGRPIEASDREDAPSVAVVSRHLARRLFDSDAPLGRQLVRRLPGGELARFTIVGVVEDVRDSGELRDALYLSYAQTATHDAAGSVYLMVRGAGVSDAWARDVPRAAARCDPRLGAAEIVLENDLYARSIAPNRVGASVLGGFAGFGLLLATLGVFGAVSFAAGQRRNEIGVRLAVGATPGQIRRLVGRQGFLLAAAGCAAGLPASLAVARILSATIPDFAGRPLLCVAVAVGLLALAAAAADVPARRAARLDPVAALGSV